MSWQPAKFDWDQLREVWLEASNDLNVYGLMAIRWNPDGRFERVDPQLVEVYDEQD